MQVLLHGAAYTQIPATENDISAAMERAEVSTAVNYPFAPVVTNMEHDLNQHPEAHDLYRTIADWITATRQIIRLARSSKRHASGATHKYREKYSAFQSIAAFSA